MKIQIVVRYWLTVVLPFITPLAFAQTAPGVEIVSAGSPDQFTPQVLKPEMPAMEALQQLTPAALPFKPADIRIRVTNRGCVVEIPLSPDEQLYGFGMQINSFNQKGLRKRPIVNDQPINDVGYTHAPVPMYVSNRGYAVLINTLRYTTFYCGSNPLRQPSASGDSSGRSDPALSVSDLYMSKEQGNGNMIVDIPGAKGIEVILFSGPDMKTAIRRYILYSGGGVLPPLSGLGIKYRVKADFNQQQVMQMARYFRDNNIPCDVLGLEPGWQTASYSCSYVWNRNKFPDPAGMAASLRQQHFELNLWEHAFVNKLSPIYQPLLSRSGDFPVWKGLVPDFADSVARKIFTYYHDTAVFSKGITGLKLDECDNSDLGSSDRTWSFPEASSFPSGISGEQMHQTFGNLYFHGFYQLMKKNNRRSYFDIRMLGALAAAYPAVLYSDIYDHDDYIRMIPNSGFCGILWSPEVRESSSVDELIRRTQTAVLSAQTVFNSWYLKSPPWLQYNTERNNADSLLPEAKQTEDIIRQLFGYRMQLAPYLYHAFFRYAHDGIPPFRALVVDYPHDKNVYQLDNEYMIGESLLAAPLVNNDSVRTVYLPEGEWYHFNTHEKYNGNKTYSIRCAPHQLPVFVKAGTILPLAKTVNYLDPGQPFDITCFIFGDKNAETTLLEDDGRSYDYKNGAYNLITLTWKNGKGKMSRQGKFKGTMYRIDKWVAVQ
jgi:alpha-D-xyloside xylohydrolase